MSETPEVLENLSKEELIVRVRALEAHVTQLRNVVSKKSNEFVSKKKKQRDFDFKRFHRRHVALKVCYLGWDYQGLTIQEDTQKTIEVELFNALIKTKLIESRETSNYHRCGRTDKEVSAFGQVISIDLRSNRAVTDDEVLLNDQVENEINYCSILNKVLPPEIRALAWAPVKPEFSARFSCKSRTYKYIFPKGTLNLERMREAGAYLVGEHDFRNLCKMDLGGGVTTFVRNIFEVSIEQTTLTDTGYDMYSLTVKGQSFLWHQIRCIVAILFHIGQQLEEPSLVKELLDVNKNPCKPQYNMAEGFPLVLFDCCFDDINWYYNSEALSTAVENLQGLWSNYAIRTEMIRKILSHLETICTEKEVPVPNLQSKSLVMGSHSRQYKPILSRPKCESFESRLEQIQKRRRKQ
ncbi:hypothetical protein CHUAL_006462 [Chamberlinius hualienensis]